MTVSFTKEWVCSNDILPHSHRDIDRKDHHLCALDRPIGALMSSSASPYKEICISERMDIFLTMMYEKEKKNLP